MTVTNGVASLTFPDDSYTLTFADLTRSKSGALVGLVTARHGAEVLHLARFDLLNQREQESFHQRCLAVNGTAADWQSRLQAAIPGLHTLVTTAWDPTTDYGWAHATTAADFLLVEEAEVLADARDLVIPGCITLIAAPRSSGKTIIAEALGLALATGGLFRGERLPQRRVLLVDRDNPPALIRKRLRCLGGQAVTGLKLLTRDKAPPLTEADAWAACPAEEYDVIIVDSIGASTEGVSEKEGKLTQQYLATLKDLAHRGPAILALDNTNKAGQNYRGRGEKGDNVDILYECRNITGWTPTQAGDWWEDLPDFGEHTWQQRASRRKGQQVLRLAFIPSKFRLAVEPEPFALEIDTRQEPWTLRDVTDEVARAGEQAAQEARRESQAQLARAAAALVATIKEHPPDEPVLVREAEAVLMAHGLTKRVARTLLKEGGNRDIHTDGWWVFRPIPGARGNAMSVVIAGEEDHGTNIYGRKSATGNADIFSPICASGSTPSGTNRDARNISNAAGENDAVFVPQPGYDMAQIDGIIDEVSCGSSDGGIICATDTPSSDDTEPCIHEHVNDADICNDCGAMIGE
jgi:hypothetical protein